MTDAVAERERRVLVLATHGSDAATTTAVLGRFDIACQICANPDELAREIEAGASAAIVSIESVGRERARLAEVIASQPPWSDFPIVLLTAGPTPSTEAFAWLGKVFMLDRPLTVNALLTTVRTAVRARSRQYDARNAIEQRDQFLAMLGHELRNPLAAIMLATDLGAATTDPAIVDRSLSTIGRQVRHLARLVDDLLDVSRVTSGKIALQRVRIDAVDLVTGCIAALDGFAGERGVRVAFAPPPPVIVEADPLRLAQVIDNLLTNAIKYNARGGAVRVRIATDAGGGAIHVQDDGIGIAPEMLPRIFDLFAQADGTLDRANGGMGIGLTLVKRLVELHDGTVEVTSAGIGRGSEFVVRLPLAPGDAPAALAPATSGMIPVTRTAAGGLRVVIVDDNEDLRELARELLERLGCQVETAADGIEGLDQIRRVRPELALVDIGLPGMNGFDVATAARAELGAGLYMVAVTGYGQAGDRARALAAGFDHHLTKPVRASAYGEVVAAARTRAG